MSLTHNVYYNDDPPLFFLSRDVYNYRFNSHALRTRWLSKLAARLRSCALEVDISVNVYLHSGNGLRVQYEVQTTTASQLSSTVIPRKLEDFPVFTCERVRERESFPQPWNRKSNRRERVRALSHVYYNNSFSASVLKERTRQELELRVH